MIKSRRDQRYYGSAFEKRDPRLDGAVAGAAYNRAVGAVANDGVMPPEEYGDAFQHAVSTMEQANQGDRSEAWSNGMDVAWTDDRLGAYKRDPDHDKYLGQRRETRNVGIPKKQPDLEEIPENAQNYAHEVATDAMESPVTPWAIRNGDGPTKYYKMLLDKGYTEDDLAKFEEMFEALDSARYEAMYDAKDNARKIRYAREGWEPEE